MVSSGFFQNVRRDYESDTTSSEDENSPSQDIVLSTPPARTVLLARLQERITHSVDIVNLRKLLTCVTPPADLVRHHPTLVSGLKMKILLKVLMKDPINRTKCMKIAVGTPGTESVELTGDAKDQILVIGVGIDAFRLATLIKKKIGYTELLLVTPLLKEKEDKKIKGARGWPWFRALKGRLFFQR